jgi:uncharacterized protein (TIGR02145 family)
MKLPDRSCVFFLFYVLLSILMTRCGDKITHEERSELITSVVWGETDQTHTDPEIYTCVFEPSGRYYTTWEGYETFLGTWQFMDKNTLRIDQVDLPIKFLDSRTLEYQGTGRIFGITYKKIYHFDALPKTRVTTIGFSDLNRTSVKLYGVIRASIPSEISFEYGTTTIYGQSVSAGNFQTAIHKNLGINIPQLDLATTYHYRIKALNSDGVFYGDDARFTTFNYQTVADADNNLYNTVTIGSQTWMVENLRTTKYNDGSHIPFVISSEKWISLDTPAFCWCDNDSITNAALGAIYNWYSVATGKICPTGWHVPSPADWSVLIDYAANKETILMMGNFNQKDEFQSTMTNLTGFSASKAIMRSPEGYFEGQGYCHLWSDFDCGNEEARHIMIFHNYMNLSQKNKRYGMQVRCIKD